MMTDVGNTRSVFVNGRSSSSIIEDMRRRIERADMRQEKIDAIKVSLSWERCIDVGLTESLLSGNA